MSSDPDTILSPPLGYVTPTFPCLYNPRAEFTRQNSSALVPGTCYLYYSNDVWRFTLYWTLICYSITFLLTGTWAFIVFSKKSVLLAAVIPLTFGFFACLVALIGASIIGFVLAAVYSVGYFSMSTWVPFLWALVQTMVAIMGSYSTSISII
ncbi:hypothetical protein CALCODRAFT_51664 [Calocera cornea HHB12733]|uniref:Integral membrane protein n=1 Tax=Calocera cornea HHB12733 TaxID=1353952 RepID=A0A165DRP0_9BASI|nr:hypothetical protein CALCODRAFT_51664 [Calocera cornea HHB12733]